MERIADLKFQGYSETQIAKQLEMKRKDVIILFDEYKDILTSDSEARDMARDHLNQMVKHYDSLIRKFYELVEEINLLNFSHQVAAQKNAALKAIADLEAKRLDALQKAGLLDSAELGDELAEMEEKHAILISILRDDLCFDCKQRVGDKLSRVTNQAEAIDVEVVNG